ncbi:hypothetical protein [Selenomonas ruminantium]|uniref:hypothetical protein n=1 Tax=Selenomonas ruminantium TaxID=971 RepID=UPI0026EFDF77|nr:hypothetical protein [Selenomonas ruminantium]
MDYSYDYVLSKVWTKIAGVEQVLSYVCNEGDEGYEVIDNARETLIDALELIDKVR